MNSVIKVKNLVKKFNGIKAVDNVSFDIKTNEVFGFLGPNGAGKTTTIRILTGVLAPDDGEVEFNGVDVSKNKIKMKEKIGVAPEISNAYSELSGFQNLVLTGQLYGLSKKECIDRSKKLIKEFGLTEHSDALFKNYSKGLKRRLILAMSLINNPTILFLDEPTSGLDVKSKRFIHNKIKEINDKGVTVFLTTHNILEADQLCDRVAIINNNLIVVERPEILKNKIEETKSIIVSFSSKLDKNLLTQSQNALKVTKVGDKYRVYSNNIDGLIREVIELTEQKEIEIVSLDTKGPSLEDVFQKFTEGGSQ
ncbi:ATP-binding cassette domain-containing protein [Methanonatronarchaeum sp. AMET-Sl]|uniref:ABC transporter ATP-binding protein n=1 Tax=Methanonatronarchaeum sp. AMET-Sl TaxID=3037654 RepID=UPI00244E05B2|nr:ATP-binding cassette domain-containing protein [Methanonatronarchaeum sp. AMET-Sl]WGI17060.1 ATP-binding cassette domain-containing protein [Methanonatronarchaeum sp. AMET-Sl]